MDPMVFNPRDDAKGLAFPIRRRVLLLASAITALALAPTPAALALVAALQLADLVASSRLLYLTENAEWDLLDACLARLALALAPLRSHRNAQITASDGQSNATTATEPNATHPQPKRNTNSPSGAPLLCIMLDALLLEHRARADATMARLVDRCEELRAKAAQTASPLSPAAQAGCLAALNAYVPSASPPDRAEQALLDALIECEREGYVPGVTPPVATHAAPPPFRAAPLADALDALERPPDAAASPALAPEAARCGYFVSHAASDGGRRKVEALRGFLCVHPLLAQLTVVLGLLALFLVPLGAALTSVIDALPFWSLGAVALGALAGAWLWVLLSQAGWCVPRRLRPWAFAPQTVWLERCCLDRSTDELKAAGLSSIGRYLSRSGGMIAFVSAAYFTDLRCVYELASFCKLHRGAQLSERLLLISLEWPGVLSPLKRAKLTREEAAWLDGFRCGDARCAVPSERAIVMSAVREVWGGEEAFEAFVRDELPPVLAESKARYSRQAGRVMYEALDAMFGG